MSKPSSSYPVLENLFNSRLRVKVLRFLFRNYPISVGAGDLARRIQEPMASVKKELDTLRRLGLLRSNKN